MNFKLKKNGIKDVVFGKNVTVIEPANLYECEIGNDSFVGPFVEVQSEAKIGDRTRIQSHSFICSLVTIGNDCFIGHGVVFINDLFSNGGPAGGDTTKYKATNIGNNVSIGSNATILPVSICDNVVIGAGSVVTKSITSAGTYFGNPAKKYN
jgi:acetyltransferase-like isoleucine patch superfamily enzyme